MHACTSAGQAAGSGSAGEAVMHCEGHVPVVGHAAGARRGAGRRHGAAGRRAAPREHATIIVLHACARKWTMPIRQRQNRRRQLRLA